MVISMRVQHGSSSGVAPPSAISDSTVRHKPSARSRSRSSCTCTAYRVMPEIAAAHPRSEPLSRCDASVKPVSGRSSEWTIPSQSSSASGSPVSAAYLVRHSTIDTGDSTEKAPSVSCGASMTRWPPSRWLMRISPSTIPRT